MDGKRYRSTIFPSYSIGGIIQFEDGYWPPIGKPPCADPGLCAYVENTELYGLYILDCTEEHLLTQEDVIRDNATLIAKAEEVMAKMAARGTLFATEPQAPPVPEAADEDRLPTPGEVKRMNKVDLVFLGERLGIADEAFKASSRVNQLKAVLGEIQAIEE